MKYDDSHAIVHANYNPVATGILVAYVTYRKVFMLRLVGGTEFKGEDRQGSSAGTNEVVAAAAPANQTALTEQARRLVLGYYLAGKAVRDWIRAPDLPTDDPLGSVTVYTDNMLLLNKLGIFLLRNGRELDMDMVNDTYGTVVDSKLLVRRIPQLKKLGLDLNGLALYY